MAWKIMRKTADDAAKDLEAAPEDGCLDEEVDKLFGSALEAGPCLDLSQVEEGPEVEEDGVNNRDIDDAASPIELDDSSPQLELAERSDDDDDDNS